MYQSKHRNQFILHFIEDSVWEIEVGKTNECFVGDAAEGKLKGSLEGFQLLKRCYV